MFNCNGNVDIQSMGEWQQMSINFLNQWNDHPLSMCLNIPLPGFVSGIVIEQSRSEYIYDIKICIIINFFVFLPEQQLPRNQLSH